MKKESKKILYLFARYLFILILGIGNLFLIYKLVTPITLFMLKNSLIFFKNAYFAGNLFYFPNFIIEIVPACVAGSAFFLLFFLIFSTADISPKKRIYALITSFAILLVLNYFRIIFLIIIADEIYFEVIHWVLWNLVSVAFVVAIWFFTAWLYKIKTIPIYSDIKYIARLRKSRR